MSTAAKRRLRKLWRLGTVEHQNPKILDVRSYAVYQSRVSFIPPKKFASQVQEQEYNWHLPFFASLALSTEQNENEHVTMIEDEKIRGKPRHQFRETESRASMSAQYFVQLQIYPA